MLYNITPILMRDRYEHLDRGEQRQSDSSRDDQFDEAVTL